MTKPKKIVYAPDFKQAAHVTFALAEKGAGIAILLRDENWVAFAGLPISVDEFYRQFQFIDNLLLEQADKPNG